MNPFGEVQLIRSEVFGSLPERYRGVRPPTPWVQVQRNGKHSDCVFEGPAFLRDGSLLVSDIPWGRIFRIQPDGSMDLVVEYDGEPNGIAVRPDGTAAVADMKNGIMLLDPAAGTIESLLPRAEVEGFKGVSDLVYAPNGDLYFTDQGLTGMHDPTGRAYRLAADGAVTRLISTLPSPNGIVIDAAGEVLYIAATRANAVWRAPLLASGEATKVGIHVQLSGGHGPDGLAFDAAGNLAVAHVGAGRILVFSPHGDLIAVVESATGPTVTNVAFGIQPGWMYFTEAESGTVLRAPWDHAAQTPYSHTT